MFFSVLAAVGATGEPHATDIAVEATAASVDVGDDRQRTCRRWGDAVLV